MTSILLYIFYFIIIITPIVFIHELGHFLFARFFGVKVEIFSIGFGKPLFKWTDKKDTVWQIAAIPLGGYVKMYGDAGADSSKDEDKISKMSKEEKALSFHHKKLWQKALIIFAGPLANYVLTFLLFLLITLCNGKAQHIPEVSGIQKDSAAEKARLQLGDLIVELNGKKVYFVEDFKLLMSTNLGETISLGILRNNEYVDINITPDMLNVKDATNTSYKHPVLGVVFEKFNYSKVGIIESMKASAWQVFSLSEIILEGVWQMITGKRDTKELGSPIKISMLSAKVVDKGFFALCGFVAMISLNLGLINLFPIPALDGGHLFYYAIEAVIRRPLNDFIQNLGMKIGIAFLVFLMAIAFWNDIKSLISVLN